MKSRTGRNPIWKWMKMTSQELKKEEKIQDVETALAKKKKLIEDTKENSPFIFKCPSLIIVRQNQNFFAGRFFLRFEL
jgi:hypothetical protein